MSFITYKIGPVDHGWEHLQTVQETLVKLSSNAESEITHNDIDPDEVLNFLNAWKSAKQTAVEKGWEGDFRHKPCVFWLPSEVSFEFGFVFKQDNNGTTFILSPQPLPSLAEFEF